MGKLYWTKDIRKLIDQKIEKDSAVVINEDVTEIMTAKVISELRIFRKYADELLEAMEEMDRKYDEEIEAFKAMKAAEEGKASDDNSGSD